MGDQYVIGIAPPDPLYSLVVNFQMGLSCALMEPHITVKAQSGLVHPPNWLEKIWSICVSTPPFPIKVNGVERFSQDVVCLQVESPGLVALHRVMVQCVDPTAEEREMYHEMEYFIPHLTLCQSLSDYKLNDVVSIVQKARALFQPFQFDAHSVKIYRASQEFELYRVWKEYRLGAECRR